MLPIKHDYDYGGKYNTVNIYLIPSLETIKKKNCAQESGFFGFYASVIVYFPLLISKQNQPVESYFNA